MIFSWRLLTMMVAVIVFVACQGDGVVSREQFEIKESDAQRKYCDADDGEKPTTHQLAGKIRVFDEDGSLQHEGTVAAFQLKATLTCTEGEMTSMVLTPVGDEGQDGKVTYVYQDASNTDVTDTFSFALDEKTIALEIDPPRAHADHRMLMWFGYDDTTPWTTRLVLHKQEELNGNLDSNFVLHTLALRAVKYSDETKKGHANFTLSLSN